GPCTRFRLQPCPFQGHPACGAKPYVRCVPTRKVRDQVGSKLLKFLVPRIAQHQVQASMEAPGPLQTWITSPPSTGLTRIFIEARKLVQKLRRSSEISDQA